MANSNAPYGFRLWSRLTGGSGAMPLSPVRLKFPSTASLKVGDPCKVSLGLGYIATGTNAIFGIITSPIGSTTWGYTGTDYQYPDVTPADMESTFRCQSIGTVNATIGYIKAGTKYRIGGTTSGYTGIDLSHTTGGVLEVLGLAPGSAFGTYAELIVSVLRGSFYGAA